MGVSKCLPTFLLNGRNTFTFRAVISIFSIFATLDDGQIQWLSGFKQEGRYEDTAS